MSFSDMKGALIFVALIFHCFHVILCDDPSRNNGDQIEEKPAKLNIADFARPVGRRITQEKKNQRKMNIEDYARPVGRKISKIATNHDKSKGLRAQNNTQPIAKTVQDIENLEKAYEILRGKIEYLQNKSRVHRKDINGSVNNNPPKYQQRPRQKLHEFYRQLRLKCGKNSPELNTPYCKLFGFLI